jgi:hypothetical protein
VTRRLDGVTARGGAQVFLAQGQKRRLTDAPRDHHQVLDGPRVEAVPQRTPDLQSLPGPQLGQPRGQFPFDQIDHIDGERTTGRIRHGLVQRQRPADQRIVAAFQSQHQELARQKSLRHLRTGESQSKRVPRQRHVLDDPHRPLQQAVGIAGGVQRSRRRRRR